MIAGRTIEIAMTTSTRPRPPARESEDYEPSAEEIAQIIARVREQADERPDFSYGSRGRSGPRGQHARRRS
jgi:hypothetical protein